MESAIPVIFLTYMSLCSSFKSTIYLVNGNNSEHFVNTRLNTINTYKHYIQQLEMEYQYLQYSMTALQHFYRIPSAGTKCK